MFPMAFPQSIEIAGDAWWVFHDLANGDTEIVVPKPFVDENVTPSAGDPMDERYQLIVLGFAWHVSATAGAEGFTLYARDSTGDRTIFKVLPEAAAQLNGQVNCYVKLSPAVVASPAANPAQLRCNAAANTTGGLLVWGLHCSAQGNRAFTGSPFSYT